MSMLPKDIDPEVLRSEVNQMTESAGWAHYCAAFDRKIGELERKIMDTRDTSDEEANALRRAREQVLFLRPDLLAIELMQSATAEIKRLTK